MSAFGPWSDVPPGWEILAEHDWAGSYEFGMLVVWRNKQSGELRAASDSGCSCPIPFEDLEYDLSDATLITEVDDLRPLLEEIDYYAPNWDALDVGLAEIKLAVGRALGGLPHG